MIEEKEWQEKSAVFSQQKSDLHKSRLASYDVMHNPIHKVMINNIFRDLKDKRRVIIVGVPGIGKSTLCQYMAYSWAEKKLWGQENFKLVIYLPLKIFLAKEFDDPNTTLADVIIKQLLQTNNGQLMAAAPRFKESLNEWLHYQADHILYIADGFDEIAPLLESQQISAKGAALRRMIEKKHVIITSRPYYIDRYFASQGINIARKLENIGLGEKDVYAYIKKFFGASGQPQQDIATSLIYLINSNPNLKGIAHIPINLSLVCYNWHKKTPQDRNDVVKMKRFSIAALYEQLLDDKLSGYLTKIGINIQNIMQRACLHTECIDVVAFLEELAFWQMQEAGLIINIQKIQDLINKYPVHAKNIKIFEKLLASTFIIPLEDEQTNQDKERNYYFFHLTFQEFMAARHLMKAIKNKNNWIECGSASAVNLKDFIKRNKYNPRYEMVWIFASGLTEKDSVFFNLCLNSHVDLIGYTEAIFLMQCVEECLPYLQNDKKELYLSRIICWLLLGISKRDYVILDRIAPILMSCPNLLRELEDLDFFLKLYDNSDDKTKELIAYFLDKIKHTPLNVALKMVKIIQEGVKGDISEYRLMDAIGHISYLTVSFIETLLNPLQENIFTKPNNKSIFLSIKILIKLATKLDAKNINNFRNKIRFILKNNEKYEIAVIQLALLAISKMGSKEDELLVAQLFYLKNSSWSQEAAQALVELGCEGTIYNFTRETPDTMQSKYEIFVSFGLLYYNLSEENVELAMQKIMQRDADLMNTSFRYLEAYIINIFDKSKAKAKELLGFIINQIEYRTVEVSNSIARLLENIHIPPRTDLCQIIIGGVKKFILHENADIALFAKKLIPPEFKIKFEPSEVIQRLELLYTKPISTSFISWGLVNYHEWDNDNRGTYQDFAIGVMLYNNGDNLANDVIQTLVNGIKSEDVKISGRATYLCMRLTGLSYELITAIFDQFQGKVKPFVYGRIFYILSQSQLLLSEADKYQVILILIGLFDKIYQYSQPDSHEINDVTVKVNSLTWDLHDFLSKALVHLIPQLTLEYQKIIFPLLRDIAKNHPSRRRREIIFPSLIALDKVSNATVEFLVTLTGEFEEFVRTNDYSATEEPTFFSFYNLTEKTPQLTDDIQIRLIQLLLNILDCAAMKFRHSDIRNLFGTIAGKWSFELKSYEILLEKYARDKFERDSCVFYFFDRCPYFPTTILIALAKQADTNPTVMSLLEDKVKKGLIPLSIWLDIYRYVQSAATKNLIYLYCIHHQVAILEEELGKVILSHPYQERTASINQLLNQSHCELEVNSQKALADFKTGNFSLKS